MKLTVFAKTMKTKEDGRKFRIYLSRLIRKGTGEEVPVKIQWSEGVAIPSTFPIIIEVSKEHAQLSRRPYTDKDGNVCEGYTLWVREYKPTGDVYVDHSLDDFED